MMELTQEQWKEARKGVKRYMSTPGWALLIYYAIMNVTVIVWMVAETVVRLIKDGFTDDPTVIENAKPPKVRGAISLRY